MNCRYPQGRLAIHMEYCPKIQCHMRIYLEGTVCSLGVHAFTDSGTVSYHFRIWLEGQNRITCRSIGSGPPIPTLLMNAINCHSTAKDEACMEANCICRCLKLTLTAQPVMCSATSGLDN